MRNRFVVAALFLFACNKNLHWSPGSSSSDSSSSSSNGSASNDGSSSSGASNDGSSNSGSSNNGSSNSGSSNEVLTSSGAPPEAMPAHGTCALKEAKLPTTSHAQQDKPIIADFNGDGKLDVAFSEALGRTDSTQKQIGDVRVYLGKGDGTFGAAIISPTPTSDSFRPEGVAGDFDGDGKLDIVLADETNPAHGNYSYILLLGKGNGSFGKPIVGTNPGAWGFYNPRAIDVDGDKKADLVASAEIEGKGTQIVVLHGGAGKLGTATPFIAKGKPQLGFELAYRDKFTWELADIDRDGVLELVVAPAGLAAVDFDRDQGYGNFGVCSVKLTKAHAIEKPQCGASTKDYAAETVALADFNGDGQLDVATGPERHSYEDSVNHLEVLMNAGKGRFEKKRRPIKADIAPLNEFWALDARDVTGDGKADIIAIGSESGGSDSIAFVLVGNGDGSFKKSIIGTTNYVSNANAAEVTFGQIQGPGTLGYAIEAWEGPETYVHVYSGRCASH